jgi:hypothetical protein
MRANGALSFISDLHKRAWAACCFEAKPLFHVAFVGEDFDAFVQGAFAYVDGEH